MTPNFTYSIKESRDKGIPFVYCPRSKVMNKWNLSDFLHRKRGIETLEQDSEYLSDPSPIVNRIFANIPFFIRRTEDTEHYLGFEYPLFTDVPISPNLYTTNVMKCFSYLVTMDKSKFTPNAVTREKVKIWLKEQR